MSPEIERVTLAYILIVARSSPVRQHLVHYAIDTNLTCEKDIVCSSLELLPRKDWWHPEGQERQDATTTSRFVTGELSSLITGVYCGWSISYKVWTRLTPIVVLCRRRGWRAGGRCNSSYRLLCSFGSRISSTVLNITDVLYSKQAWYVNGSRLKYFPKLTIMYHRCCCRQRRHRSQIPCSE